MGGGGRALVGKASGQREHEAGEDLYRQAGHCLLVPRVLGGRYPLKRHPLERRNQTRIALAEAQGTESAWRWLRVRLDGSRIGRILLAPTRIHVITHVTLTLLYILYCGRRDAVGRRPIAKRANLVGPSSRCFVACHAFSWEFWVSWVDYAPRRARPRASPIGLGPSGSLSSRGRRLSRACKQWRWASRSCTCSCWRRRPRRTSARWRTARRDRWPHDRFNSRCAKLSCTRMHGPRTRPRPVRAPHAHTVDIAPRAPVAAILGHTHAYWSHRSRVSRRWPTQHALARASSHSDSLRFALFSYRIYRHSAGRTPRFQARSR